MKKVLPLIMSIFVSLSLAIATEITTPSKKLGNIIVYGTNAAFPMKNIAEELKKYLSKITGENYSLSSEDKLPVGSPAIYLGITDFASKHGLDFTHFSEEEYAIRSVGENLIIGGGLPNGIANGVYHFLTRELGCRFLAWDCEIIPKHKNLQLPTINLRRKPSFAGRTVYIPHWRLPYTTKVQKFLKRNFSNQYNSAFDRISKTRDATQPHNFYFWVDPRKYAKSNSEFYSNKKFTTPLWPRNQEGQLCMTNHKVWKITLNKLRECIKKDQAELSKWQQPTTYQITQNDTELYCTCSNCTKAVKLAGGSQAGPLLQYVNFVAEAIAKEYPKIQIKTFAYTAGEDVPANIRPAKNVIIEWCDLFSRSDCYRPLSHEFNHKQKARLDSWKNIGARLNVWDYWNMGGGTFSSMLPRVETMVDAIAPDLRHFNQAGVEALFLEAEMDLKNPQNFMDLQYYLALQLMADVSLSEASLIKEFLNGYYGLAAPTMEKLLNLIRQAVKDEKKPLYYNVNQIRTYTNGKFLEKVYNLLRKALSTVPDNSDYARRIKREMITPLAVILNNPRYNFFQRTGLKKADLIAEYRAVRLSQIEQLSVPTERQVKYKAQLETDIKTMTTEFPIPDQFKGKTVLKFFWPNFRVESNVAKLISDPDSPMGKALVGCSINGKLHDLRNPFISKMYPNTFGIYGRSNKNHTPNVRTQVLQDEKYHWYKIGIFDFVPKTILWGFYWNFTVNLYSVYNSNDGTTDQNVWEAWISVKYTGPAYVKNSKQPNQVFLDRVLLVKPALPKPVKPFISDQKLIINLDSLTLNSANKMENFVRLNGVPHAGIASATYAAIPLNGIKRIKITLKYRTNITKSELHKGAWYCFVFTNKGYSRGANGFTFPLSKEWAQMEKIIEVPADATKVSAQLRIQGIFTGKFLETRDIVIKLEKQRKN